MCLQTFFHAELHADFLKPSTLLRFKENCRPVFKCSLGVKQNQFLNHSLEDLLFHIHRVVDSKVFSAFCANDCVPRHENHTQIVLQTRINVYVDTGVDISVVTLNIISSIMAHPDMGKEILFRALFSCFGIFLSLLLQSIQKVFLHRQRSV